MPSKKRGTVWKAEPHTLAKIAMLKAYLHAYFPILGTTKRGLPFLYVDGFAGPGEYTNSAECSPLAALAAAKVTRGQLGEKWVAGAITCIFMEPDHSRCEHLRGRIKGFADDPFLLIKVMEKSFVDGMAQLMKELPQPFASSDPLFVFIDPFGATGVPFDVVRRILATECSEVLINLDADGVVRIFSAANPNRDEQLTAVFGDESWRSALLPEEPFDVLCRRVLELYKTKLRALAGISYVFAFEMRGKTDALNYYLVFASHNPLGLTKMKEAMRTIDQSGQYMFSDGGIGQDLLFRFDDPKHFADALHKKFENRKAAYEELNDFALNETPFINPKAMLRSLEDRSMVKVESSNPKRRRNEFNEKTLVSVTFVRPTSGPRGLFDGNAE
ncbi:MAG TPA: three-Cys-motif partner protein TcmP [Tepidisphaeraceae bacterium]|jgi:three-Cys-motif partner protein|nr:three-Cys-motif partner protein TcmP [Tepidisphaeraceae bacterium]